MHTVFVIATDWTLRAGVRAELRELGIDALGMDSADDAGRALAENQTPPPSFWRPPPASPTIPLSKLS